MNDPLVRLSEVIEVVLKSEEGEELLSKDALLVELLRRFKTPLKPIPQNLN